MRVEKSFVRNLVFEPEIIEQPLLTRLQSTHHRSSPSLQISIRQNHVPNHKAIGLFQQPQPEAVKQGPNVFGGYPTIADI